MTNVLLYAAIFFYALTAFFFIRLFVWKKYSEYYYWKKRPMLTLREVDYLARHQQADYPFISLIVPAKDESLVISKTIENLLHLNYPSQNFEIIIVTDEREEIAFKQAGKDLSVTTAGIAKQWKETCRATGHQLKVLTVPLNFDGKYNGYQLDHEVPSTKGRALNYALMHLDASSVIAGFYDAESRPDHKTLLYIAYEYLLKGEEMPILQGPLFQVRNFYRLGPASRLGGLFKAISHDWHLPVIFKRLPFVGGTHFYVCRSVIDTIKGFDLSALTEDLDFGVRAYQAQGKKVEFLPVISTEQTPPRFSQFFKQRLRWASGHLQVMSSLKKRDVLYWRLFFRGPFEWMIYQGAAIAVVSMNIYLLCVKLGWAASSQLFPVSLESFFGLLNIPYFLFSYYCFKRYAFTYDKDHHLSQSIPGFDVFRIIVSSLMVFLLPLPYTYALWLNLFNKKPTGWVKTVRTAE